MSYFRLWKIVWSFWIFLLSERRRSETLGAMMLLLLPPGIVAVWSLLAKFEISQQYYAELVSVFSIFAAFLFASQISAFTVYRILQDGALRHGHAAASNLEDQLTSRVVAAERSVRLAQLSEGFKGINASISYLVLLAVSVLVVYFFAIIFEHQGIVLTAVISFISAHFLLVLLVVLLMCHEIFEAGYDQGK